MKKIKLPKMETFASKTKKEMSPFEKFHFWVAKKCGVPKGKKINVSASKLTNEDYLKLEKLVARWAKIQRPYASEHSLKLAVGMHNLEIGPSNWQKGDAPKGTKSGFVYVDESQLVQGE